MSYISKKLGCYYYAVYKIYYIHNKDKCKNNASLLNKYKQKTNETNFSLSQNTGLSVSVIAKLLSPVKKYRVNPRYYHKLFEYLQSQVHSSPSSKTVLAKKEPVVLIQKKQIMYATDILILASLLGKNSFAKSIPEKFFHDYLYKSFIYAPSMPKVILMLKRHGLIQSVNGSIYVSHYPLMDVSEKKQKLLISSLSQYFNKIENFPNAFGWSLLGDIKKRTDEYLFKSICFYEQKKDIESLQILIDSYEKKYKRTTPYIYALLLYTKLYRSIKQSKSITKKFMLMKLFLKRIGVFDSEKPMDLIKKLEYEIHYIFFLIYDYFINFWCMNLSIKTIEYYLNSIYGKKSKYSLYHYIMPLRYYLDTNNVIQTEKLLGSLTNISLTLMDTSEKNAYYINFLFYYLTKSDKINIQKYIKLIEQNGTDNISLKNLMLRFELLCLLYLNKKQYEKALAWALLWYNEQYKNQMNTFNTLLYIRISLSFLKSKTISTLDDMFFAPSSKKSCLAVSFDGAKALKGLALLLKTCRVNSKTSEVPVNSIIHWLDNYMTAFRRRIYTKKMLRNSTYRFIRKIREIDKDLETKSPDEFLNILNSILSYNPKETSISIPHASSANLIMVHSLNYGLYEYLFKKKKTVSKKFPPIVPEYIQRLFVVSTKKI